MALSRCLNKQFRGLFTVAILFLIKRVKKEKKSVPGTSRFWELTRRTTYSPSESQSAKQKTHHAPARFKTFSKAVHCMAVPHFGTFGVALNGFFEFWQEKKKKSTRFQNVTHRCHEQYDWQKYRCTFLLVLFTPLAVVVIDPQIRDCVWVALVGAFRVPVRMEKHQTTFSMDRIRNV